MIDKSTLETLRALEQQATPSPWAWESIADQSNEFAVGQAWDAKGQPIAGEIPVGESIEDTIMERRELVGMNESGHANFADARLICELRNLLPFLLDAATPAPTPTWQPIETAPPSHTSEDEANGSGRVLVFVPSPRVDEMTGVFPAIRSRLTGQWVIPHSGGATVFPTHWMPLPPAPRPSSL